MPCIYKITNKLNQKVYIGKTTKTLHERWRGHCKERKRDRAKDRPLYAAMNQYGEENFVIEKIEECSVDVLNEREQYWIEYYHSCIDGYNLALGGDGKRYADYQLIYRYWLDGLSCTDISKQLNISHNTVEHALDNYNVSHQDRVRQGVLPYVKKVKRIDENGDVVIFNTITEAYASMNKEKSNHIQQVCNHKRKMAYGYFWEWYDDE